MSSTSSDLARRKQHADSARRSAVAVIIAVVALLTVTGCDSKAANERAESTSTSGGSDSAVVNSPAMVASGWNVDAGPMMILPTVDGGMTSGSLIRPDATELTVGDTAGLGAAIGAAQVELFARSGKVGSAKFSIESAARVDSGCTAWPIARMAVAGGQPSLPWTAAFLAGRVSAVSLDSIEGLSTRDSARLAVDLTRLASGLRDDSVATFRGLPFVVLRAWRSKGLDTGFVVATLARRVNQEDAPKEERLVLVVDQIGTDSRQWTVAWHERASGSEDELVVAEPLLAFRAARSPDVHLLFGRDDGVALGAAVLTRTSSGWRVQWESAVAGCD